MVGPANAIRGDNDSADGVLGRCEVQFDYGLRQKRYKKLADRPESFVSAEGKTITVSQTVAAANDRTVTRGKVRARPCTGYDVVSHPIHSRCTKS